MRLALFDLDNTLLAGDSDHAFGLFLKNHGIVTETFYQEVYLHSYEQYSEGMLDIEVYLKATLAPLKTLSLAKLNELRVIFMDEVIAPMIQPKALKLVQEHEDRGHKTLVITSTNHFIARPICECLGIKTLLAVDLEIKNRRFTGNYLGTLSFRQGKVKRMKEWLKGKPYSLSNSYFYSDSHNDLPLLEAVQYPIAVDPEPKLKAIATERQWSIISLR